MWRTPLQVASFGLLAVLAKGVVLHPQVPPERVNPAESLRRYLAARGAMASRWWQFAPDLNQLYSTLSRGSAPGCPLGQFRDQPDVASTTSVNVFVVDFKSSPEAMCQAAPDARACRAIADSCAAVGTSIFCDYKFLERRETLAAHAYRSAWRGLSRARDGANVVFAPLPREALTDLGRSTLAAREAGPAPADGAITTEAKRLMRTASSTVSDLAASVSLLLPVMHEIGHIEQGFCGRGLTTSKEYEDFVASLMFSGEIDWQVQTSLYETLTCSNLARNELAADLRSVDMLMRYLEDEAPKAAANPRFEFSAEVGLATRRELLPLARWSREAALLGLMYGLEYDVLLYQDPGRGLSVARAEPENASPRVLAVHYLDAAGDRGMPLVRGHLEPAFRAMVLTRHLHMERLSLINSGRSTTEAHTRLVPFITGRMRAINERSCGADGATKIAGLDDFVLDAVVGPTRAPDIRRTGPGSLEAANEWLARFVAPGADYRALTTSLRPRLEDLRAIFDPPFADRAFKHYEELFSADEGIEPKDGQTEVLVRAVTSDRLLWLGGSSTLPGGYQKIAKRFRPGVTIFSWKFAQPGAHFGYAFDGLYYLNGRWVLVPKPYRVQ